MSGTTYNLCRNPRVYKKLVDEIRSSFSEYNQINGHSTEHLPYLHAVIDEGLRIYPPVPIGMGRFSPGETVDGIYIPEGVRTPSP
jgi:cytochrome P450